MEPAAADGAGPGPGTRPAAGASTGQASHRLLALGVAVAVLVVDQLTKWWALRALDDGPVDVVWTLRLRLVFNRDTAFNLVSGYGVAIAVVGIVGVAVAAVLVGRGRLVSDRLSAAIVGLVAGGALGNLVDRTFRGDDGWFTGAVVDFVDLRWWPVFNVADAAVVVGALLVVVEVARPRREPAS